MKTNLRSIATVIGLTAVMGGAHLIAESPTRSKAEIPFDFQVNRKTRLPAGEYTVRYMRDIRALTFTSEATGKTALVLAHQFRSGLKMDPKLVFQFDGETYRLHEVWFAGVDGGFGPLKSTRDSVSKERGMLATVRMGR
ncbi:MAG TPA: hypothetical protein VL285_15305 [Bryobacteraceae bacterium]|jgi:hypothetical protein|nr:hypothetical protein [Bryobacteraceae bacterium]